MVKNVKQWLTKQGGGVQFGVALSEFLRTYRNVPHSTTGRSPAQIVFGRALCTRLSFVLPCMCERVKEQLQPQEGLSIPQVFSQGAGVWIRDFCSLHVDARYNTVISWSLYYTVSTQDGFQRKAHIDHLLRRSDSPVYHQTSLMYDRRIQMWQSS